VVLSSLWDVGPHKQNHEQGMTLNGKKGTSTKYIRGSTRSCTKTKRTGGLAKDAGVVAAPSTPGKPPIQHVISR
jgi:hypothetical protein